MLSLSATPQEFVRQLSELTFKNVFNPYSDHCKLWDKDNAAQIRRLNLLKVLEATLAHGVESVWIARDLGHRGGRRTGIAMTDDAHLQTCATSYRLSSLDRATLGPPIAERTATVVWSSILSARQRIFLWNVFPLHPHLAGDQFSNRCHNDRERAQTLPFIMWIVANIRPKSIVAIGRDAQRALSLAKIQYQCARHPSYGGQTEFKETMQRLRSTNDIR